MDYLFLLLGALVYGFACYLTYSDCKQQWWYVPVGVLLGAFASGVWFIAARVIDDKQRMFVFSLIWDSMLFLIYYSLPMLIFGTKMNRWMVLGLTLVVAGVILLKVKA